MTSSGHIWTTEDSNLTSQMKYTTLSDRTVINLQGLIFTRPISEGTRERLVQAILDHHPSICQNNSLLSQDNIANNTQLSPLNETPLNNLPSFNSDPEPLPQIQNWNTTSNLSSNNPKHNNKPSSNTSILKCLSQQTPPLQIHKHHSQLPSI